MEPHTIDHAAITAFIQERVPEMVALYLFGSQAGDQAQPGSDLDLALLAQTPIAGERLFDISQTLAMQLRRDVDLLDLRAASTVMRMQVLAKGIRLATVDTRATSEFEMYAYSDYARLNEERKDLLRHITQRGTVYG